MAQRDKEETKLKMIESMTLCINNCGVYGNPSTKNMCQTCFESSTKLKISTTNTKSSSIQSPNEPDLIVQEEGKLSKKVVVVQSLTFSSSEKFRSSSIKTSDGSDPSVKIRKSDDLVCKIDEKKPVEEKKIVRVINRCSGCRRKVGLTGFRCRCGELFCPEHRYSDRHDCSYDYKAHGREAIARENPVVRPAKILKV
ncbi:hypothetical protein MKW94_025305 [Papaver nudicaule]|uniref:Uncharacterized protein n=1 Tax=Papaver nudicaule TaxID=74823 RepID=A0AA41VA58_PAPNU|nr:hypothetical protein [Papaver nudicaule]